MKKEFGNIYLSWRKGTGESRHIVGILKQNATIGVQFSYYKDLKNAYADGFIPYTEFPKTDEIYKNDVLNIFSQRLIKAERSDISDFTKFWEIDERKMHDKLYLLAHTQGLSPLDNFEFLANFNPIKSYSFVTELAGLSHLKLLPSLVGVRDSLKIELDKTNPKDGYAVKVFKNDIFLGYIKKIHNKVFHKIKGNYPSITVKAVDFNGVIKRIFIKVSF